MSERASVAILASGDPASGAGGSTMERFIRDAQAGIIDVDVPLVICNNSRLAVPGFYERIDNINREFGLRIEALTISGKTHPGHPQERGQTLDEAEAIFKATEDVGYVCMLGYMKKVNGLLMEARGWKPEYSKRDPDHQGMYFASMTNNHPAKLPETADTHGWGAHRRAIELGLPASAFTLQVAAPRIDDGPTIEEFLVPITDEMRRADLDTAATMLQEVVMAEEKRQTAPAIGRFIAARQSFLEIPA